METKKVLISEIVNGKYFAGSKESIQPSYVITSFGQKISRVNLVGTVTEKFVSGDAKYAVIVVDDGSGAVRIKNFGDGVKLIEGAEIGELVLVVGKIREYKGEVYVNGDILKKIVDPNYESFRKLEVMNRLIDEKRIAMSVKILANQMREDELKNYVKNNLGIDEDSLKVILESKSQEQDYKPAIMSIIEKLDSGSGVEVKNIFESSGLDENKVESAINELLESGVLYEPVVGVLKKV